MFHIFRTYKQVELFPGPNLNMIIGPNGTGKSTFVCAIVLGLCGKTTILGRAKKIGDYVRSGCREATIEIELCQQKGKKNVVITRNFNLENTSVWSIDRKAAKEKDVVELIQSLNIRVDNLCQLLPQDRVQDFAKMNPQELLKSTQLAVSGHEAVSLLDELIQLKLEHRNLSSQITTSALQLQENEQLNSRLEAVIASMREMKKLKKQIDMCEKKKVWAEYENLKGAVDRLKSDKDEAVKLIKNYEKKLEPYRKTIKKMEDTNQNFETKRKKASTTIGIVKNNINELLESSISFVGKIDEIESDYEAKVAQQANRLRDIDLAKMTLLKMQSDKDNLINTYGDEKSLNTKMAEIHKPVQKLNATLSELRNKKTDTQYEIDSRIAPQKRLCENKLRELSDAKNKRLELLRNFSEPTFKAVQWLRENRDMFSSNVYEPMILELNFSDSKYAKYLENTVAVRDLIAFTFEDINDMNLFLKKIRVESNLKTVNAVFSPPREQPYQSPIPLESIKHLGFFTFLVDLISGPTAIINFLCKQYGIHKIPIGDDKTYNSSQNVPKEISYFYSENHRFTIKTSAYSGAKSTTTNEIRAARLLANTIDHDAMNKIKTQLEVLSSRHKTKLADIENISKEMKSNEEELNGLIAKRQKLHESLEQIKTIMSRVRMQQNKVSTMENEPSFDIETENIKCRKEIEKCVLEQCRLQKKISDGFKQLQIQTGVVDYLALRIKHIYNSVLEKNREMTELRTNISNLEHTLTKIEDQFATAKNAAKDKLKEAKSITGNHLPHEPEFPFAKEFSKLPGDINEIQEHLAMLQARAECMDTADPHAAEEYEKRKKTIILLRQNIDKMQKDCKDGEEKMVILRDRWLTPLDEQINNINQRFGEMFSQLGCAGEVKILKDGAEDDFDKYGISILVRFRDEEKLQQLNQHIQSGGERALATALYLMALQQLSKAPFRCVDEINQGMDPINERKMFQLLVKVTTECDKSSQYFLLTPKLLYGLDYSPSIKVHTIMNGPQAIKYSKWNLKQFFQRAR